MQFPRSPFYSERKISGIHIFDREVQTESAPDEANFEKGKGNHGEKDPGIYLFTITLVATLLLFNLTTQGIYSSHDGEIHLARFAQFIQILLDGQFPPRWLSNWNFGYGYPTFVYLYSLPYYLSSFLRIFGLAFETIFKILMFLSLSLSGITFYFLANNLVSQKQKTFKIAAFVGAIFYISAPYRFADIYERGALGESLAFILIPLLFSTPTIFLKDIKKGFITTSIIIFAFITTHALTFLIFLPFAFIYSAFLFKKNLKFYLVFTISITFGFLLASFQWIPMIFEQKYINLPKTYFEIFQGTFLSVNQLLRNPKVGVNIGTGVQLGVAQSMITLISFVIIFYKFIKTKRLDLVYVFFLTATAIAAFVTTDLSKEIWYTVKPLQTILFPWRFLTFTTFTCAVLATYVVSLLPKGRWNFLIITALPLLAIFPSRHYLKGSGWHSFSDIYYLNYYDPLKLDNYYLPKGLTQNLENLKLPEISPVQGEGDFKPLKRKSNLMIAAANLKKDSKIQFHTIYFPGWKFSLDGKDSPIITNYPGLEGLIIADVPKGVHSLSLEFKETPLRKTANLLSLIGVVLLIFISFSAYNFRKK